MHSSKEDVNWEIHMQAYYNIAKNDPSKLKSFVFTTASAKKFLKTDGTLYSVMDTMIEGYIVNSGVLTQDLSKQVKGVVPNDLDVNFTCKDIPNAEAVLTNLSCSNAHFCKATESLDENEFENFMHTYFKKYVEVNESECLNRKLPKYENTKKENNKERRAVRRETEVVKEEEIGNCFRTAREEMWLQNSKKNDNKGSNLQQSSSSKRKLGMRGGVQRKFVSPVLSSNDMEQTAHKSEDNLSDFEMDERYRNIEPKMVELIKSEIMDNVISVTWSDIAGLEFAKTAIQEAIIWPMLRPDIFKGLRRPPKGILLFGPPGTGKTLIGKCVASQSKSTFFSISASSLTSKWIGDGEKMVRALFTVARCHQPAVIFIDEVDSLLSQRSDSEHESSRRIKTEFLVQLDGATTDSEERLLIIGATNRPQELDEAARRRFVKRLYIPLPEEEARYDLVKTLMQSERNCLSDKDFREIAQLSDGYSGADMRNLCSEASLGPIRSIDINLIERIDPSQVRPVEFNDFSKAFLRVRPSVAAKDLLQYVQWDQVYGSGNSF